MGSASLAADHLPARPNHDDNTPQARRAEVVKQLTHINGID